jgi:hypothetical protein
MSASVEHRWLKLFLTMVLEGAGNMRSLGPPRWPERSPGGADYRGPGRMAGYSKIALTMIAANANPATTPAAMAADNSNMNSPIVIYPTAYRRRCRDRLCCSACFTRESPRAWRENLRTLLGILRLRTGHVSSHRRG